MEPDFALGHQSPNASNPNTRPPVSLPFDQLPNWPALLLAGFLAYATLCSLLRFRRIKAVRARYGYTDRASLARMTNEDAQSITKSIAQFEFPLYYDAGSRLALLETYSVENIAKLLTSASDLNKWDTLPKRYEDTEVIFASFLMFPPTSEQLHKAISRMNYLHAPYIKSGKISQADLLYVAYAAISEPIRFINQYEWRQLDDMEVAAITTTWKYVCDMMSIDYQSLLGKEEWVDGIEFLEDMTRWASDYEDQYMRPLPEVRELGKILMKMLLHSYPSIARPLGYPLACALMGNRLRRCFDFPEPSLALTVLSYSLLLARKLFVRFLCLPRFAPVEYISQPDKETGRIKHNHYMMEPWYVPQTFWNRWNPEAVITRLFGGMIPGSDNSRMMPEGFLWEEIGPQNRFGKGVEECREMEKVIRGKATGSCPFSMGGKR